ncbi:ROK family protein [Gluconobacter wancherniae]|uniref:Glucokinase n=1 Tax=Gluconobacter wancherniae NBRC 103581 TaxID=656744 RepID=A0A511B0K2_9PROT|nr:ROK family protein [Gluconobacter wancherniae]MBF0854205.1 ROK family protein [Gluconobacter wancherniae]MBS1062598.1 ROK family protein [Gluconobacter wancherniae]MBS1088665.1 ROK family protein [Gluconobacter wancherniae]MBS1094736.1 ROK family protein [Gluconobacter wancherniae]GBD57262.1 fructokinase [Gluconobacter wancherniae NBRC 103581]
MADYRLGIDLGGTKIEIAALDRSGELVLRERIPNPGIYPEAVIAVRDLVANVEKRLGCVSSHIATDGQKSSTLGIGIPGAISPETGLIKNSNATWLNNQPFGRDLEAAMARPVRSENDANCFALSEASDGAGVGAATVFGVIIGTGMGAGIVTRGQVVTGRHHIAGEWGHLPLPWVTLEEFPMRKCFCGNEGCLERYLCGAALAEDWKGPGSKSAAGIEDAARNGDQTAVAALDRYMDRFARACAMIINVLDPDMIVLGGGLSNLDTIYDKVPPLLARNVITPTCTTPIVRNKHGDSSGVRGAAWLWDVTE